MMSNDLPPTRPQTPGDHPTQETATGHDKIPEGALQEKSATAGIGEEDAQEILKLFQLERHEISIHNTPPLMNPILLHALNELVPGFASRAVQEFLDEAEFRRSQEERTNLATIKYQNLKMVLGYALGFGLCFLLILLSAFALHLGHPTAAGFIATTGIVGAATIFVLGKRYQHNS